MKTTLSYLPENKQKEISSIAGRIKELAQVEMIILFGSYARGDYKEQKDLAPDRKSGHVSDYDILVITEDKKLAKDINLWNCLEKFEGLNLSTHVRVISHDVEFINIQLAEGRYFFSDIKKEGAMLYDSGKFKLADKRELKPVEQQRIAQDYFDEWFEQAQHFYDDFESNLKKERYKKAAFELHQAAERSYKTVLLVFTEYNPCEHLLGMLGRMAVKHEPKLEGIFPQETREDEELFELLDYAYIGARYDPMYVIRLDQLEVLAKRVKKLMDLTEKACKERIELL